MTYYSQIGQDKYYIENIVKYKKNGRFLDIGANDGITESNTYCLEKEYNWSGICVEGSEELAKICSRNRPQSVVSCSLVWSGEEEVNFVEPKNGKNLLSRIDNIVWNKEYFVNDFIDPITSKRTTTTIKNILGDGYHYFDYFSLDVEGAELEALKGIDWNNTKFGFITIEYGNREHYKNLVISFLQKVSYRIHRINKWDIEFCP
jgi:FkbM family methyltransferase